MFTKKMAEIIVNLALRGVLGVLAIHFINLYMGSHGYPSVVGINLCTIPVVTCLGMPGLGLLYVFAIFW